LAIDDCLSITTTIEAGPFDLWTQVSELRRGNPDENEELVRTSCNELNLFILFCIEGHAIVIEEEGVGAIVMMGRLGLGTCL
jgi:hypothetical protein